MRAIMPLKTGRLIFLFLFVSGCSSPGAAATSTPATASQTPPITATLALTPTSIPTKTSTLTPTATQTALPSTQVCSPLEDIRLNELSQLMNGDIFDPPAPGRDDGHHGVDFAFYRFGDLTTMLGLPVQAILPGKVAAVIDDEKPYGNAIIIETPFENMPTAWQATINLPLAAATVQPDPRLTCPDPTLKPWMSSGKRSIYHLYAHLNKLPPMKVGDNVSCGQVIGEVGTTGNSVNPHLHLETRVGPAGATFIGLGHYDTRLSEEDRSNYCTWRVSGWFQMFDPMKILNQQP
jgi:murein DD-endopeptidase MepM/ murein hydrolase activator NlpD